MVLEERKYEGWKIYSYRRDLVTIVVDFFELPLAQNE